MYSNYCCSYSFEPGIIKIGLSSHKMYRNNIVNFQDNSKCPYEKGLETYRMHLVIHFFKLVTTNMFTYEYCYCFNYCYQTLLILFNINHLFAHSEVVTRITI